MASAPKKSVSIVVPCYNEAQMLDTFIARMDSVTVPLDAFVFEYIFVDDGSTDGTEACLAAHARKNPKVKAVVLSRNVGHQRAIQAGLDACETEYVIIMDVDLQDPPELVPDILGRLEAGYDLVHTVRTDRSADGFTKRFTAKLFYSFMRRWVLPELPENAGDFKGFDRRILLAMRRYREHVRFLRGLCATLGFRQTTLPFTRPKRHAGHSKYNLKKVLRLARDAIVSNSAVPIRAGFYGGLVLWALLPVYAAVLLAMHAAGGLAQPSLWVMFGVCLFLFGFTLVLLGLIGEYLKVIILEVKARPLYLVRTRYNLPDPPDEHLPWHR
ncbi:MAG: glycosyltransferase family 2 protein [Candidatus Hydrogenedentota bacterium]